MIRFVVRRAAVLAAALLGVVPLSHQGFAQQSMRPRDSKPAAVKPAQPPPPALPGAQGGTGAAPPSTAVLDMPPNEALFDSINRGDIAAARDALNRGADLNAQNVLGMTPMELSVDLGRNDISFLLLSMRGERGPRRAETAASSAAPNQAKPVAAKPASKPVERRATAAAVPAQAPKLYANDGGAPNPQAGFLGFDSNRSR